MPFYLFWISHLTHLAWFESFLNYCRPKIHLLSDQNVLSDIYVNCLIVLWPYSAFLRHAITQLGGSISWIRPSITSINMILVYSIKAKDFIRNVTFISNTLQILKIRILTKNLLAFNFQINKIYWIFENEEKTLRSIDIISMIFRESNAKVAIIFVI